MPPRPTRKIASSPAAAVPKVGKLRGRKVNPSGSSSSSEGSARCDYCNQPGSPVLFCGRHHDLFDAGSIVEEHRRAFAELTSDAVLTQVIGIGHSLASKCAAVMCEFDMTPGRPSDEEMAVLEDVNRVLRRRLQIVHDLTNQLLAAEWVVADHMFRNENELLAAREFQLSSQVLPNAQALVNAHTRPQSRARGNPL